MCEFKNYHPTINFIYYIFAIVFSCLFMHPIALAISFFAGFVYAVTVKGAEYIKKYLLCIVPSFVVMALINPAFNHKGATILAYLPSGNPLTFESVMYGMAAAAMIVSVILYFIGFNEVITSDKFICVLGKGIPTLSLVISMSLQFVPRFARRIKSVRKYRKTLLNTGKGGVLNTIKEGLSVLSVVTTWGLENAIDTATSMRAKGYGLPGRTSFSIFKFTKRDVRALIVLLSLGIYVIIGVVSGCFEYSYFPIIKTADASPYGVSVFGAYFLFMVFPVITEIKEAIKWKSLKSKI